MLGRLIRKEVREMILDLRFTIASLLCLALIPLGTYINVRGYEQKVADYQRRHQNYRRQHEKDITYDVKAEGYKPPSVLSIFVYGLEDAIPDKIITSRDGIFTVDKTLAFVNSPFLLFGQADLLFSVSVVLSLAALIFTFNSISGEKEAGTLKLVLANRIPRYRILLSKILGNYICLVVPFMISLVVSLVFLEFSLDILVASQEFYLTFLAIVGVSLLFVFVMVTVGVSISAFTHRSLTSMTMCLLVWMVLALAIPRVSPMISRVVYTVEPQTQMEKKRDALLMDIEDSFQEKSLEACDRYIDVTQQDLGKYMLGKYFGSEQLPTSAGDNVKPVAALEQELAVLDRERQRRIATEVGGLDQDYRNRTGLQNAIAMNLSRTSPISCYTFLVSGLAGTGVMEFDNFRINAQRYQDQIKQSIYDKFIAREVRFGEGTGCLTVSTQAPEKLPDIQYRRLSIIEALHAGWVDLVLLVAFSFIFFALAFVGFNRYDVR